MKINDLIYEAKYYQQKDVYIHTDSGFPFEVIEWRNPYEVPNGAIITIRDLETGEEQVYSEEEFLSTFQKVEK